MNYRKDSPVFKKSKQTTFMKTTLSFIPSPFLMWRNHYRRIYCLTFTSSVVVWVSRASSFSVNKIIALRYLIRFLMKLGCAFGCRL